jgi:Kef-type K+ transport system membrane component KefB
LLLLASTAAAADTAKTAAPPPPLAPHQLLVFLLQVGVLLTAAILLGRLANRCKLPAVVGELAAGILLGPSLLAHASSGLFRWLFPSQPEQFHLLDAFGQIGVLLLVGITGASLDLGLVRRRGATALRVSVAGLVVPLGLGVAAGFVVPATLIAGENDDRVVFALFLGVAMCVSAIPVIAKTLTDLRLLHRDIGQLTLAAGVVDDIVGWFLLSIVSALATVGLHARQLTTPLIWLGVVALFAASVGRPLVRLLLRPVTRDDGSGTAVAAVCALILAGSAATQAMGLEAILGAFVCGLLISSAGTLTAQRLAPLRTLVLAVLAPLYFATAGLRADLTALTKLDVLAAGAAILAIAILGKFAGAYLGARLSRMSRREAIALGAGMNARGVIEVVVAMTGLRLGVLNTGTYTIVILVAMVTSLMAPPILRRTVAQLESSAEERERERRLLPQPEIEREPQPVG